MFASRRGLYINTVHEPYSRVITDMVKSGDPRAQALQFIARQPISFWVVNEAGVENLKDVASDATRKNQTPIVTLYNIPNRDNGGYSAGGSMSTAQYLEWVERVAAVLANVPSIIIVEPDALAHATGFRPSMQWERLELLAQVTAMLKSSQPNHAVYIDAGHGNWLAPRQAADLLGKAGIERADGFSLNVSNFIPTSNNVAYGEKISALLGGSHFVIDTSRNGAPVLPRGFFNPKGQALGLSPTTAVAHDLVDAYLWIKVPGESDGNNRPGTPKAGVFSPPYAFELVNNLSTQTYTPSS